MPEQPSWHSTRTLSTGRVIRLEPQLWAKGGVLDWRNPGEDSGRWVIAHGFRGGIRDRPYAECFGVHDDGGGVATPDRCWPLLPPRAMLSDDPAERRRECWELLCGVADSASDGVAYWHIEPDTSSCLAINRTELRLRGYFNGTADMALLGKAQNIGTVLQRWLATMDVTE